MIHSALSCTSAKRSEQCLPGVAASAKIAPLRSAATELPSHRWRRRYLLSGALSLVCSLPCAFAAQGSSRSGLLRLRMRAPTGARGGTAVTRAPTRSLLHEGCAVAYRKSQDLPFADRGAHAVKDVFVQVSGLLCPCATWYVFLAEHLIASSIVSVGSTTRAGRSLWMGNRTSTAPKAPRSPT
jgi:hypothetical protein